MNWSACAAAALSVGISLGTNAGAQGIATGGFRGSVTTEGARPVDARVRVTHEGTGFSVEVRTSGDRFLVQGLEPGGPYTLTARAVGLMPQRRPGIFIKLGELGEIDFTLAALTAVIDTVTITSRGGESSRSAHADGGTGMTIPPSMLEGLPTLNRDLYDFVRLVPQVSTKIGLSNPGISAGGVGFRFNNFLINGVSDRTLSGGVSNAFAGARSIPLDAVQEYQVLLSPYDVRYGDFAGALVNAVTKSGTNQLRGSIFGFGRNDRLARAASNGVNSYKKAQYGLSLGGPIVRDRLHFFIAPEIQHFTSAAPGPYAGQPPGSERPVPVGDADLDRFSSILTEYGLTPGSAGSVENAKPLRTVFTRLDLAIPEWKSRLAVWNNYSSSEDEAFTRASPDTFSLSSLALTNVASFRTNALQLHTNIARAGGGHNELLLSDRTNELRSVGPVQQPVVRVSVPAISGGQVTLSSGTNLNAQGTGVRSGAFTVRDNMTLPFGSGHILTIGGEVERFRIRRRGVAGSYGTWSFASLNDLERGVAERYEGRVNFGNANAPISGNQYAAYVSDQWRLSDRVSMTLGLRGDQLDINERAPYHPLVDSSFGRRTDRMPRRRIEISPRLGFVWDVTGRERVQLRGGLGIFTGRYPLGWAHSALISNGVGGLVRCSSLGSGRAPPLFNPDYQKAPTACAGSASVTALQPGDVDLLDEDLRMMRVARGSLAYDFRLPGNFTITSEALITRSLSDFILVNLNLPEVVSTDTYGRAMYGAIRTDGVVTTNFRSPFTEVIDLRNTSRNRSYQLSTRLEGKPTAGMAGSFSYTFSRARDVQTPLRVATRGITAWASSRATGGRHDDETPGVSSNDLPHRVIVTGSYAIPRTGGRTALSFYYVGESGRPFTYLASGTRGRGDLNADGSNGNDPIYIPRNARDTLELLFSGISGQFGADSSAAAQAQRILEQRNAFEAFVERSSCLRRQRGRILQRNSCREPWSNTTIASLRQRFPGGAEVQLDLFNVLNILDPGWGLRREAVPAILEHVGQTTGSVPTSRPVFRFNPTDTGLTTDQEESSFQLQIALRYRF